MSGSDPATDGSIDRRRFRGIGAIHLLLAAIVNTLTGIALVYVGSTNHLSRWAIANLDIYMSSQTLVRDAGTIVFLATTGAVLAGVTLLAIGVIAAAVAWSAFRGARSSWWLPTGLVSGINPLAAPLALVAATLLWMGRPIENEKPTGLRKHSSHDSVENG